MKVKKAATNEESDKNCHHNNIGIPQPNWVTILLRKPPCHFPSSSSPAYLQALREERFSLFKFPKTEGEKYRFFHFFYCIDNCHYYQTTTLISCLCNTIN